MEFGVAAQMMDQVDESSAENIKHLNAVTEALDGALSQCAAVLQSARGTGHAKHVEECIGAAEVARDAVSDAIDRLTVASMKAIDAAASLRG